MENIFFFLDYIKFNVEYNYFYTLLLFSLYLLTYNAISIPGNIIFIAASGYFFGIFIGFLISIFSLVLGSLIFVSFASYVLKKITPNFIKVYSKKINNYINDSSFEYLIILRIIPGPPLMLQNLILSSLKISKSKVFLSTLIGFSPFVFITVFVGEALNNMEKLKNLSIEDIFSIEFILFILFVIFILVIRIFYKKK